MKPHNNGPSWLTLENGQWKIDDEKADVVRWIYKLAYAGRSSREILVLLYDENVKPIGKRLVGGKAKTHWSENDIDALLSNPAVCGIQTSKGRQRITYPEIIDRDWWDDIQWMRDRSPGGQQRSPNTFSGLLHCGECERALRLRTFKNRMYVECYDGCIKRKYYDTLEPLLIEHIFGHVLFIRNPEWELDVNPVADRRNKLIRQRHAGLLRRHIDRVEVSNDVVTVVRRSGAVTELELP